MAYSEQTLGFPGAVEAVAPRFDVAVGAIVARRPKAPTPCAAPAADAPHAGVFDASDCAHDPERQLWCAVIIHTLYEAAGRIGYAERGEHAGVRREAVAWFEDADEDFQAVCELAGFVPDAIRTGALRVIGCGRLPRMRISRAG